MTAPSCRVCQRVLATGEDAWQEEWKVLTPEGWRIADRYVCDDCAGPESAPHTDNCPDPCMHDGECPHGNVTTCHTCEEEYAP